MALSQSSRTSSTSSSVGRPGARRWKSLCGFPDEINGRVGLHFVDLAFAGLLNGAFPIGQEDLLDFVIRAILDLTKGISTMFEAVSRRLRGDQGECLWDSDVEGLQRSGFELP